MTLTFFSHDTYYPQGESPTGLLQYILLFRA